MCVCLWYSFKCGRSALLLYGKKARDGQVGVEVRSERRGWPGSA